MAGDQAYLGESQTTSRASRSVVGEEQEMAGRVKEKKKRRASIGRAALQRTKMKYFVGHGGVSVISLVVHVSSLSSNIQFPEKILKTKNI